MLAPEWIRISGKAAANWVTPAKVEAIRAEFVRQCDKLDGLADGIINNYMACRAIFDMSQGAANRNPWASKRCPNNVDPNPQDTTAAACFTDGQISTFKLVYSRYKFATPLANGSKTFGMWVPNDGSFGQRPHRKHALQRTGRRARKTPEPFSPWCSRCDRILDEEYAQPILSTMLKAEVRNARREEISAWLDSTNPDLSAFAGRGGKMIVAIGTNDTLASPGAQLDYYQSVLDKMGRQAVDGFARFYVIPKQVTASRVRATRRMATDRAIPASQIPSRFDRISMLLDWVEKGTAPPKSATVTGDAGSLPLCSYPTYPQYNEVRQADAASYTCVAP